MGLPRHGKDWKYSKTKYNEADYIDNYEFTYI